MRCFYQDIFVIVFVPSGLSQHLCPCFDSVQEKSNKEIDLTYKLKVLQQELEQEETSHKATRALLADKSKIKVTIEGAKSESMKGERTNLLCPGCCSLAYLLVYFNCLFIPVWTTLDIISCEGESIHTRLSEMIPDFTVLQFLICATIAMSDFVQKGSYISSCILIVLNTAHSESI